MIKLEEIKLRLPVGHPKEVVLTQKFGETKYFDYSVYGYPGHNGTDLSTFYGGEELILSAAKGVVAKVGNDATGYGRYVEVEHDGYTTLYAHLERVYMAVGDGIDEGHPIGVMGSTGNSTGRHLHFELRVPGQGEVGYPKGQRDPMPFIKAMEVEVPAGETVISVGDTLVVVADPLNIRAGPDIEAEDVGDLQYGTKITAEVVAGEWVGFTVYCHRKWLKAA